MLVWSLMLVGADLWGLLGIGGLLRRLLLIRRRPWFVCESVRVDGLEVAVAVQMLMARLRCVVCRKVDDDGRLMLNARPKSSRNHEVILGFCSLGAPSSRVSITAMRWTSFATEHQSLLQLSTCSDETTTKNTRWSQNRHATHQLRSTSQQNKSRGKYPPITFSHDHYHDSTQSSLSDSEPNSCAVSHALRPASLAHSPSLH
jgi:hypothetical protein